MIAKPQATPGTCGKMKPIAPAATVETSSGHRRLRMTAPGRCSGSIVAIFASASSRPMGAVTCGAAAERDADERPGDPPAGRDEDERVVVDRAWRR